MKQIISILGLFMLFGCVTETQQLVGWEYDTYCKQGVSCEGQYCCYEWAGEGGSSKYVAMYSRCENMNSPWSSERRQREEDRLSSMLEEFYSLGYTDCGRTTFYDFSSSGEYRGDCIVVACQTCPEGLAKQYTYVTAYNNDRYKTAVTCSEPECTDGETRTKKCGNGEMIESEQCIDSFWYTTNNECCVDDEEILTTCSNGETILEFECRDNDWVRVNSCPSFPIVPVSIGAGVLGLGGLGFWFFRKRWK